MTLKPSGSTRRAMSLTRAGAETQLRLFYILVKMQHKRSISALSGFLQGQVACAACLV